MKRIRLFLLCVLSLLVTTGCDEGGPEIADFVPQVDPGSIHDNCCGVTHGTSISGVAPAGGQYYVLALLREDTLVSYGEPVYIPEGPYADVELEVSVSYLDELPPGHYRKEVQAFSSLEDIRNLESRKIVQAAGVAEIVSYAGEDCEPCCTREDDGGLRRYRAYAIKDLENVIGAAAFIESRFGKLCSEGSSIPAQTGAWVGIQDHISGTETSFCQVGYMIQRYSDVLTDTLIYFEIKPYADQHPYLFDANLPGSYVPEDGHTSEYGFVLYPDEAVAAVHVTYPGGTLWLEVPHWQNKVVRYATWQGEIDGRETDMPGTYGAPCHFSSCCYFLNDAVQSPYDANFNANDIIMVTPQMGPRDDEWGIYCPPNDNVLEIWDENPLP